MTRLQAVNGWAANRREEEEEERMMGGKWVSM
jgi:hypothetical protein